MASPNDKKSGAPQASGTQLLEAANKAVMNKDLEADVAAPEGLDAKHGVSLPVPQSERTKNSVVSRTAYNVEGQLYIQDTVIQPNGDLRELWKRGKRPLAN